MERIQGLKEYVQTEHYLEGIGIGKEEQKEIQITYQPLAQGEYNINYWFVHPLTGKKLVQMNVENSPVKDAYALCFAEGDPEGRMSWDHTAVLVAIKGYEPYFDVERGTFHVVDDEGTNNWVANPNGRDLRLIEKMPPTEVASLIENYMMHQRSIK